MQHPPAFTVPAQVALLLRVARGVAEMGRSRDGELPPRAGVQRDHVEDRQPIGPVQGFIGAANARRVRGVRRPNSANGGKSKRGQASLSSANAKGKCGPVSRQRLPAFARWIAARLMAVLYRPSHGKSVPMSLARGTGLAHAHTSPARPRRRAVPHCPVASRLPCGTRSCEAGPGPHARFGCSPGLSILDWFDPVPRSTPSRFGATGAILPPDWPDHSAAQSSGARPPCRRCSRDVGAGAGIRGASMAYG
jgi:hypothetical protein